MTEEHKQKIRDGLARKRAALLQEAATDNIGPSNPPKELELHSSPPVTNAAGVPTIHVTASPAGANESFADWLRTKDGLDASDPRVPQDRIRFAIHLEDMLRRAYLAGFNAASV